MVAYMRIYVREKTRHKSQELYAGTYVHTGIQAFMPLCPRAYAGICADICVDISHLVFPTVLDHDAQNDLFLSDF